MRWWTSFHGWVRRVVAPLTLVMWGLAGVMMAMAPMDAQAGGPLDPRPGPWSLAREQGCANGSTLDCYLWLLDPPTSAVQIGFEIHYDSSKMTILPEQSGFLCGFSDGGSCPLTAPGTSGTNGASMVVGGPRAGTDYTFTVTPDTITLAYDLTANPAPLGPDQNFFAIAFTSPYPGVAFTTEPLTGDFYQVSTSCQTTDPFMSCKSDHPIFGATLLPVPEPDGWWLALAGCVPLGLRVAKASRRGRA